MRPNRIHLVELTALLLICSAPAYADTSDIRWSDSGLEVDGGAQWFKYGEDVAGHTFDTEKDWLPAFKIDGGILTGDDTQWPVLSDLYAHLSLQVTSGDAHYNGGLQNIFTGQSTPFQSTTHETVYTISGRLGHAFPVSNQVMMIPMVDLGYRSWNRALTGTGGYTEDYTNGEAMGGLLAQFSPLSGWVFSLTGEAGTTLSPQLKTLGNTYTLGESTVWNFEGKAGYRISNNFELTGTIGEKGFGFGKSNSIGNGSYEPGSYTHELTTLVGIAYHLY